MDDNDLFEADSLGSKYTWANGQSGVRRILCKLDRAIINEAWLNKFENWRCKALPREVSDHSTLIGYPFANSRPKRAPFRVQKMWFSHPDFLRMVVESWNAPVSGSPACIFPFKLKRLKAAMKEWNLRVFGNVYAKLKQDKLTREVALRISDEDPEDLQKLNSAKEASVTLQEIHTQQAILLKQKARNKWLMEGASNNSFFHTNIHTRRSSNMISELVDDNGNVLTDCDQIKDFAVSFFEANILADDSQRMDAIPTFEEIKAVVFDLGADSAPGPDGFSGCFYRHCWEVRGANTLRNFRPIGLSNFFFKIFTKILTIRLGSVLDNLVSEEQVSFMKGRNIHENISVASEMVNDLKTKRKDGNVGLKLDISQAFDTVSWSFVLEVFRRTITNLLGMEVFTFPDRYLGVQIMPGADPVVLINSVIASYAIHNMDVYKWPRKFIQQAERVIRNFLWSDDAETTRKFVVGYEKVCFPVKEGGLGITIMSVTNRALLMKLWWNICASNKKWARFLWSKLTTRSGRIKQYGVSSSILRGIRLVHTMVDRNTKVIIGDGRSTSLYFDIWYGTESIADMLGDINLDRSVLVSDIIADNNWQLDGEHVQILVRAGVDLNNLPDLRNAADCRVWMPELDGIFSVSSAKHLIRKKYATAIVYGLLWRKAIHPKLAAQNWKLTRAACATQDKLRSRCKIELASRCYLCRNEEESLDHIIWSCSYAAQIWDWISGNFKLRPHLDIVTSYKSAKGRSRIVKDLRLLSNMVIRSKLWLSRNMDYFQNKSVSIQFFKQRAFHLIHEYSVRLKGYMHNTTEDLEILNVFRVRHRQVKTNSTIGMFLDSSKY
ncbi:uncharacterized protein LOC113294975 [Papaver somniferum]|uniref:uncharacterized protein LOC113294975 n=1 Tax=Papaver somniferum TaxID=3469 RepID=UPI000E6F6B32|nr:uncharacterized protein LOC113294975 [Papaver somniferum]